jgi:hypothetical protein
MAYDIIVINIKDPIPQSYWSIEVMRSNVLGNPYVLKDESQRDSCIEKYGQYLWNEMQNPKSTVLKTLKRAAHTANNIAIVCDCAPKHCDGDVVKSAILWLRKHPKHMFQKW